MKLTAMRGYAASGKSTIAAQIAKDTGAVIVNRDYLRMMLHGTWYSGKPELEDQVTIAERAQVRAFLKAGVSVIVDATHLNVHYLRKWAKLAVEVGAEFEVVDVPTRLEHCIIRDRLRGIDGKRAVGDVVIQRMAKQAPIKNWPVVGIPQSTPVEPIEWVDGLPEAIIVDIDGTVAHMAGRSPYDYTQVHTDTVDEHVVWLVNRIADLRYTTGGFRTKVLFCSGRDDSCRDETLKWLDNSCIPHDELFMRPTDAKDNHGNKLPDYQVKLDLFNKYIRGKYNVRFVLDDRNQVVDLWRRLGLKCLQVEPGDF